MLNDFYKWILVTKDECVLKSLQPSANVTFLHFHHKSNQNTGIGDLIDDVSIYTYYSIILLCSSHINTPRHTPRRIDIYKYVYMRRCVGTNKHTHTHIYICTHTYIYIYITDWSL